MAMGVRSTSSVKMKAVRINSKLTTWERLNVLSALESRLDYWVTSGSVNAIAVNQLKSLIDKIEANDVFLD